MIDSDVTLCRRSVSDRPLSPATRPGYHRGRRPANAGQRYPVEILTPDEVQALLAACEAGSAPGTRNRALIALLYRTGLRAAEALALQPKDVDLGRGTVTVLSGKGGRRRTVGIDAGASELLELWVRARAELPGAGSEWLFCTSRGTAVAPSYLRTLLPRLARRAGISKRVHPHGLRHTHAAELALEGFPMNLIQAQLGHSSLETTDRYLRHIAPADLVRAIQQRQWQAR